MNRGIVKELFISKNDKRVKTDKILVDENGIVGDKFYAKDKDRTILITSFDSYNLAKVNGIETEFGTLGENILIDINIYNLLPTDKIKIGNIFFEVTQNCTICKSLAKIDPKLPKILKTDRGIFFKALTAGEIYVGDIIEII